MATEETAQFAIKVDADAEAAAEAASELEKLKKAIDQSKGAVESYQKSLRMLRGSSAEVVDAKAKLKAAIEVERGRMSAANLSILKLGSSYDKLSKASKKATSETVQGRQAIASVGGPLKGLLDKFDGLKDMLPALSSGWGLLAAGVAASVAVIALAGAAIADLTVKFTEWLLKTADMNRNMRLTLEAMTGSAKNAENLTNILQNLRSSVALTNEELTKLAAENDRAFRGAYISGTGLADSFRAAAFAAGAGREDVAAFFREILERGKLTGRAFVGPQDFARFRNAGIDVKALYKELGVSAAQAGRGVVVSTDRMAAALAKVSENRFAEINGKKLLSLGAQWDLFKDRLLMLTNKLAGEGGALEPLLKAIAQLGQAFDLTTDSGKELQAAVTQYGKALADAIVTHIPQIKAFVVEAIKLAAAFIQGAAAVYNFASSETGLTLIKSALIGVAVAAGVVLVAMLPLIVVGLAIAAVFLVVGLAIYGIYKAVKWIAGLDWGGIGKAIVDGIKNGLTAAWEGLKSAVQTMGEGIKKTFEKALLIHSPSQVFAHYGAMTAVGYRQGVERGTPAVATATTAMAAEATSPAASTAVAVESTRSDSRSGSSGGATGSASGGASRSLTVGEISLNFNISGGDPEKVKQAIQSPGLLEGLESSIRVLLQSQAIPTGTPVTSGG